MSYHPWLFKLNCNRHDHQYPSSISEIQICKLLRFLIIIEPIGQDCSFSSKNMMLLRSFKFSLISLWQMRRFSSTSDGLTRDSINHIPHIVMFVKFMERDEIDSISWWILVVRCPLRQTRYIPYTTQRSHIPDFKSHSSIVSRRMHLPMVSWWSDQIVAFALKGLSSEQVILTVLFC